jgi:hypothetical protein
MKALHAEEVLRDRGASLTPEQLYYYMIRAGHDRGAAEVARERRRLDLTR